MADSEQLPNRPARDAVATIPTATETRVIAPRRPRGLLSARGPTARLVAVLLICVAPAIAAAAYVGIGLRGRVEATSGDLIVREAELAAVDMGNVIYAAKQLTRNVALFPSVRAMSPACGEELAVLQPQVPRYAFIAVLDAEGAIVCSSRHDSAGLAPGMHLPWAMDMRAAGGFSIGQFTAMPLGAPFLPIEKTMRDSGVASGGAVIAAIDLKWLAAHMVNLWRIRAPLPDNTAILVADRDGTILTRYPDNDPWMGRPLPEGALAQVRSATPGDGILSRLDSDGWLAVALPPTAAQGDLSTIVFADGAGGAPAPYLTRPKALLLFAGAVCLGLALAAFAGRRLLVRPLQKQIGQRNRIDGEQHDRSDGIAPDVTALAGRLPDIAAQLESEAAARNAAEAALRQSQRLQAVGQLSGGIAHDFNNMLATILGSLELMERRIPSAGADATELLQGLIDRAIEAVQRAARLTAHMTAVSRRQQMTERPTDINRLIDDLAALAGGTLGRGLRVEIEPGADPWLALVDASLAEAAIVALCLSAREAMPAVGLLTIATANISHDSGDWVGVTVHGPRQAMNLDELNSLASACGGGVHVAGAPAQNLTVTLLLPRAPLPPPLATQADAPYAARSPLAGVRVMVVDDDPAVREVTTDMLLALGCEPLEASCADDALALLANSPDSVGLFLLDYAMPGRNGIELLRALRERGLTVPAVLVTGHAELVDLDDAGPNAVLRKPFTTGELRATLSRLHRLAQSETVQS